MAASSVVCTWLVAACRSVACEKDQQQQPMMMMMNQSSSKRFSRWARKRRVLSKCRAGCSEISKGRLISSGIQGLMSSYLPFEPCDEYYSSKGLCSSDFFGDNGFSSLFGSTNVPLSRRQRRFNRAVHSVFLGKQSERADQQAQVLDSILEDASDNDTNSGSGILFEDKICVKHWHCPWGSTVVDYIAPVFRLILEENYLSSSMQPLKDTKKNRSLWWMQRKSLDQRLGKFLRDLEDSWFGPIVQFLLLGEWSGCEHQESQKKLMHNLKVKCKVDAHESLIKVIIGGAKHICEREESILQLILNKGCFIDGVGYCNQERWGTYADTSDGVESLSKKALKLILEAAREVEEEECLNREPVILVLDFDVQGGKDHASARYIYTRLSPITRFMFPKDDDILLDYLNEDGQSIEPVWYMPVIPLVLVNGSEDVWYCDMMGSASCSTPITEKSVLRDHRPLPLGEDDYLRVCRIPRRKVVYGANFRDLPGIIVGADNVVQRDLTVEPILMPSGKPLVPDYAINFCDGKSTRPFSRLWWDETVPTLLCRPDLHSQSILHPEQDRVLTIRECARLQGFPDYYEFCGSVKERYCQVGNAVAVPVARALGFALGMAVRKLTGDEPIMTLPPKFSHSPASCCNLHPI